MEYEVVVVGCGPAGLSAAIYLGRAHVKTILVGRYKQSQLMKAHKIENFFGFPRGISGKALLKRGIKQVKKFKVVISDHEVIDAEQIKGSFKIKLENNEEITAKVLLLATGTPIKLSGIQNEERLTGKGVHYCVECDGAFYKDKKLAVIGDSNHAAENALDLRIFSKDLTIISNSEKFVFSPMLNKEIQKRNIKLINARVTAFEGRKMLESVVITDNSKLKFDGVFMACGVASALDFASKLGIIVKENIVEVDGNNMTNIKGIFAAGNCSGKCRQVAKNIGDGCNAALNVIKYLRNQKIYFDYSK